jgi:hypothetical protein
MKIMENISDHTAAAIRTVRRLFFPAWYLPNGTINATEDELEGASESCERWSVWCGVLVLVSVAAEFIIDLVEPSYALFLRLSAITGAGVAIGIVGEVSFSMRDARIQTELRRRLTSSLSDAVKVAGEANERAARIDLARTELEAQLSPRMLNQRQWDLIQSLKGQFSVINIGYETDAESWWFAMELRKAFMSAGIKGGMFPRDPSVHTFSIMVFEPHGFDGPRPKTVGPLVELFKAEDQLKHGTAAIIAGFPNDILQQAGASEGWKALLVQTPMIIIGGRFMVPPSHWPKPPKQA